MSMTSESDERMISSSIDSPSIDDANSGGTTGGNGQLKKGPWTSAEDAILVEYVNKHGEGNWNAVQKHSGLARCGKSCRLRWANHLRPDLKKGAFTPEEERCIIELHAKMGNKWARMAAELPGRTDNEIKNFWNTRIKRLHRLGLPIYPPEICMQAMNESQQSDGMNTFSSGEVHHPDFISMNNFDIPVVEFKNAELYQNLPPHLDIPPGSLQNMPPSSLLEQGLNSYPNKPLLSTFQPSKRLRESEPFPGLTAGITDCFAGGNEYQNGVSSQISASFGFVPPYDQNSTSNHLSLLPGSHAVLNGNPSSESTWAMKPELPSLQNQMGTWGLPLPLHSPSSSSPVPHYESLDVLIQTPPNEDAQTSSLSPQNSGLLDAVIYGAEAKKDPTSNGDEHGSFSVSNTTFNMMTNATHDLQDTEWEMYEDQLSPLGNSSPMCARLFDDHYLVGTFPGCKVKEELGNLDLLQYDDAANQMFFSRPDFLLASNCFSPMKHSAKDGSLLKEAVGTLLSDELNLDCNQIDADAASPAQGHSHSHVACAWNVNAMPTV